MKTIVAKAGTKAYADLTRRAGRKHVYTVSVMMTCNETHGKWRFEDVVRRDLSFAVQAKSQAAAERAVRKKVRPVARPGRSCAVKINYLGPW